MQAPSPKEVSGLVNNYVYPFFDFCTRTNTRKVMTHSHSGDIAGRPWRILLGVTDILPYSHPWRGCRRKGSRRRGNPYSLLIEERQTVERPRGSSLLQEITRADQDRHSQLEVERSWVPECAQSVALHSHFPQYLYRFCEWEYRQGDCQS